MRSPTYGHRGIHGLFAKVIHKHSTAQSECFSSSVQSKWSSHLLQVSTSCTMVELFHLFISPIINIRCLEKVSLMPIHLS